MFFIQIIFGLWIAGGVSHAQKAEGIDPLKMLEAINAIKEDCRHELAVSKVPEESRAKKMKECVQEGRNSITPGIESRADKEAERDRKKAEELKKEAKQDCQNAFKELKEKHSEFTEACTKVGGRGKCFEMATRCQDCMASDQKSSSGLSRHSALRRTQKKCRKDQVKNRTQSLTPNFMDALSGQPFQSQAPRSEQLEQKRKLYQSCPLISTGGLKELREESKDLQQELKTIEEQLVDLQKEVDEAKNKESKAQGAHEQTIRDTNKSFKDQVTALKEGLKAAQQRQIAQITALQQGLNQNELAVDNVKLQRAEAKSIYKDKLQEEKFKCLDKAEGDVNRQSAKRLERISSNTHSRGIRNFYKNARRSNYKNDRARLNNRRARCLSSTRYQEARDIHYRAYERALARFDLELTNLNKNRNQILAQINSLRTSLGPELASQQQTLTELQAEWKQAINNEYLRYYGDPDPRVQRFGERAQLENARRVAEEVFKRAQQDMRERQGEFQELTSLVRLADAKSGGHSSDKGDPEDMLQKATTLQNYADSAANICDCKPEDNYKGSGAACGLVRQLYNQGDFSRKRGKRSHTFEAGDS